MGNDGNQISINQHSIHTQIRSNTSMISRILLQLQCSSISPSFLNKLILSRGSLNGSFTVMCIQQILCEIIITENKNQIISYSTQQQSSLLTEIMIRWYCLIKWNVKMFTFSMCVHPSFFVSETRLKFFKKHLRRGPCRESP